MPSAIHRFLDNNRDWAERLSKTPDYFDKLKEGQHPVALLLGCSDSRVSPSTVMGTELGELFIHRNIANVVAHADLNFLSVMQYAVEVLKVRHIIVYGHYGCGGIKAAMTDAAIGLMDNWLANIKDVIALHSDDLAAIPDEEARFRRLVELNVLAQLNNLRHTSVYRKAMKQEWELYLHGWVYDFTDGLIHILSSDEPGANLLANVPAEQLQETLACGHEGHEHHL